MKWIEDYATGIEQIDQDHKMIFQMCEDFCSALDDGSGADVYSVMLDNLTLYCRGHFDRAEARLLVDTTNQWLQSHICDVDIHLKHCVNK